MHLGIGAILQPAIRIGDRYAMVNIRHGISGGRWCARVGGAPAGSVGGKQN
jgi:hypothetical protein